MREPDLVGGHPAKKMNHIAGLRGVPPTHEFGLDADGCQRALRLLDLDLRAAMREQRGHVAIKDDLHAALERKLFLIPLLPPANCAA